MTTVTYPLFKGWYPNNAMPLAGGLLYSYEPHTDTRAVTYSDPYCTIPNTNPVVLNSVGEAPVYIAGARKLVLKDSTGVVIWTVDEVTPCNLWIFYPATSVGLGALLLENGSYLLLESGDKLLLEA